MSRDKAKERRCTTKTRPNGYSDNAIVIYGLFCVESCHCRRQGGSGSIRTAPMKPPYKKTREPRGIRLACFSGPIAPAVERRGRFKCAVAILHEGEMPRARRVKKSAQDGLEIHLRLPRLPGPFSVVKHKQTSSLRQKIGEPEQSTDRNIKGRVRSDGRIVAPLSCAGSRQQIFLAGGRPPPRSDVVTGRRHSQLDRSMEERRPTDTTAAPSSASARETSTANNICTESSGRALSNSCARREERHRVSSPGD